MHEIASRQEVPPRFLEQLMLALRRSRMVESKRGARGGYSLVRRPDRITLREIVEALEGTVVLLDCLDETAERGCERASSCAIREALMQAQGRMLRSLESWSLADLLTRQRELERRCELTYEI